jgi:hypothetical protein
MRRSRDGIREPGLLVRDSVQLAANLVPVLRPTGLLESGSRGGDHLLHQRRVEHVPGDRGQHGAVDRRHRPLLDVGAHLWSAGVAGRAGVEEHALAPVGSTAHVRANLR